MSLRNPHSFHLPADARVQQESEDGVRCPAGESLGKVMARGEAWVAEPAGYLGYYSRAKFYDWPGLTSPTMVAALRPLPQPERTLSASIAALEPESLALRPPELATLRSQFPDVAQRYCPLKPFKTEVSLSRWSIGYFNIDREFWILRRKD